MGYVDGFSNDLFISYSHIDDRPFGEHQKQWVSDFHRDLEIRIQHYLGTTTNSWRDRKLDGVDLFSDEISTQLKASAVLVSIVSPAYLNSDWCIKELQVFAQHAEVDRGLSVGNKQRIVKVIKTPISRQALPAVLSALTGYEFYNVEHGTGRAREFHLSPDREIRLAYWARVDDVAQDVRKLFDGLAAQRPLSRDPIGSVDTVYLAEAPADQQWVRDRVRRELEDHGYNVVPGSQLPVRSEEAIQLMRRELTLSSLSVHLVGSTYGWIPEGETRSVVHIQAEVAAEQNVPRVIWIPEHLQTKDERQIAFIHNLRNCSDVLHGFELLETSLEDLKSVILEKLDIVLRPRRIAPAREHTRKTIYLIIDTLDANDVIPLRDYLIGRGFEVALPLARGDVAQIREDHRENLLCCEAVLIYWGHGDEFWVRSKFRDMIRTRGLGRTAPFLGRAVYIAGPPHPSKDDLPVSDLIVLRGSATFSHETLEPFLSFLEARRTATP